VKNPYDVLEERARTAKTLDDSAQVLYDLLAGGYSVWTDGSLYNIKALVARVKGLQIHIYPKEHPPPHFHVKSPDVEATFTIDDCTYVVGNIDGREQALVRWWYARSRPLLVAKWNALRPSDCPVGPIEEGNAV
jgi:hypothetical protein